MLKKLYFVLACLVFFPTSAYSNGNSGAAPQELVRHSEGNNNTIFSYVRGSCNPETLGKAEGLIENVILEPAMGRFKESHLNCCTKTIIKACGNEIETAGDAESLRGSNLNNCLQHGKRGLGRLSGANTVCINEACIAWARDCGKEFDIEDLYNKFHNIED